MSKDPNEQMPFWLITNKSILSLLKFAQFFLYFIDADKHPCIHSYMKITSVSLLFVKRAK